MAGDNYTWKELGWVEEAKFPNSRGARLYPLLRLDPMDPGTPLVRTPLGEARLLSVGTTTADVLLERDRMVHERAMTLREKGQKVPPVARVALPFHQVAPPNEPPPAWQTEAARVEVRRLAEGRRRGHAVSEFAKSFAVCAVLWLSTFALASWLFPGSA